jgi:hypothetical protein
VKLGVDGKFGLITRGVIQAFQVKHFGWGGADSRVDPGKKTLENHATHSTFETQKHEVRPASHGFRADYLGTGQPALLARHR